MENEDPVVVVDDGSVDESADPGSFFRTARRAGLVSGPRVENVRRLGGEAFAADIEFTLGVEEPWFYGATKYALRRVVFDGEEYPSVDVTCPTGPEFEPACFPAAVALGSGAVDTCYVRPPTVFNRCVTIQNPGRLESGTLLVEIEAGSTALKNLRITAYERRVGDPLPPGCGEATDITVYECNRKVAVVELAEIPAGSSLTIDGRDRDSQLRLASGTILPGERFVTGNAGAPLAYLDIAPAATIHLLVEADVDETAADCLLSVGYAPRFVMD